MHALHGMPELENNITSASGALRVLRYLTRGSLVLDRVSDRGQPSGSKLQAKRRNMHLDESLAVLLCTADADENTWPTTRSSSRSSLRL